jgi:hypothetical protein
MSTQEDLGTQLSVLRGNVRLTSDAPDPVPRTAEPDPTPYDAAAVQEVAPQGWSVHDGDGRAVLAGLSSRSEAIRLMGGLALRGATLPLCVHRPDGSATGEHLA